VESSDHPFNPKETILSSESVKRLEEEMDAEDAASRLERNEADLSTVV